MPSKVRQAIELMREHLAEVDHGVLDGAGARRHLVESADLERLAAASKMLAAGRVDELGAHDGSYRSTAHYLAKMSGTSVGAAAQVIDTAHQVEQLSETEAALRDGRLSGAQAKEVGAAASADPSAESLLLRRAETDGLKGLKAESKRVVAAAAIDADTTYDRIYGERSWRHWQDWDGTGRIDIRGPIDLTTRIANSLAAYEAELFARVKDQDPAEREPHRALMFDAALAQAEACTGEMPAGSGPMPVVTVRIDHAAFLRGDTKPGEVCEIAGVGPIPVSVARCLAEDAFMKALITNGTDVLAISHLGRTISTHLRSAIDDLYPECAVAGCNAAWGLDVDHNVPLEFGGRTELDNLQKLCRFHHHYKHRHDLRLLGVGTQKTFVPALEWLPADRDRRTLEPLAAA
ncbi:MAG: DUF222 domain-containing protein [Actinobacteria bacterium]|nr:DUF222 domain-containing protein [Actinomycetota bacterium]